MWHELDAPYELACVRTLIGLAYRQLNDHDGAQLEFDAAQDTFDRLGATPDAARVAALSGVASPPSCVGGLTGREVEVLRLVATGATNREIASRLAISEKTVLAPEQHKLDLPSRSAATAYASTSWSRGRIARKYPRPVRRAAYRRCAACPRCSRIRDNREDPMSNATTAQRVNTVVIGGGQAGLSVGYHLSRRQVPFVILDASERLGDAWRHRWNSLRLFTPARFDGLDGLPFPAPPHSFPTKNDMADYLGAYARHFDLPVRLGVRVERLSRQGDRFVVVSGKERYEADNVVVAMSNYQRARIPAFARDLNPEIVQLHSSEYRSPSQLRPGGLLVVGAGNSGAELALENARTRRTWLAGRDTGHIPFRIDGLAARLVLARFFLRVVFHRVLTVATPLGRRMRAKTLSTGSPLIRLKPHELTAAGVERVARVKAVERFSGARRRPRPRVANVIWCTGFDPVFLDRSGVRRERPGSARSRRCVQVNQDSSSDCCSLRSIVGRDPRCWPRRRQNCESHRRPGVCRNRSASTLDGSMRGYGCLTS
jgi:putative flavoprotein involved in K+ transport